MTKRGEAEVDDGGGVERSRLTTVGSGGRGNGEAEVYDGRPAPMGLEDGGVGVKT
jgi:hypothetical protein